MRDLLVTRPLLPVGTLLLLLGLGNWVVSHSKLLEYTERVRASSTVETAEPITGLPLLTTQQNFALIEHLHRRHGNYSLAQAKIDFYQIVKVGGQVFAVLGLLFVATAIVRIRQDHRWRPSGAIPK